MWDFALWVKCTEPIEIMMSKKTFDSCSKARLELLDSGARVRFEDSQKIRDITSYPANGVYSFKLKGGTEQTTSLADKIEIQARCGDQPGALVIARYQFTVCAHPVNFHIWQNPEPPDLKTEVVYTKGKCGALYRIANVVTWLWSSDSGDIEDLDKVWVRENYRVIGLLEKDAVQRNPGTFVYQTNWDRRRARIDLIDAFLQRWPDLNPFHDISIGGHEADCERCGQTRKLGIDTIDSAYYREPTRRRLVLNEDGYCIWPPGCESQYSWVVTSEVAADLTVDCNP